MEAFGFLVNEEALTSVTQIKKGVLDKNSLFPGHKPFTLSINKSIKCVEVIIIKHLEGVMCIISDTVKKKREH